MEESLRRAVERHPLLWVAAMALGAVLCADGNWLLGGAGFASAGLALGYLGKWRVLTWAAAVAVTAGWLHHQDVSRRAELVEQMGASRSGPIEARVLEEPRTFGSGWAALAETSSGDRVWLRARGRAWPAGSVVAGRGVYEPLAGPRNPGQFDVRPWLERQGGFAAFQGGGSIILVQPPAGWRRFGDGIKSRFREAVTRGLDPLSREAAVIRAVVLGEHPDDDVLIEPFRRSGTLHVFAVSGLHVGMVGLIGWVLLRALGVSRRGAVLPLLMMMFGYAWLTGLKPPAVRAAWMAALVLGAFWFRRRPAVLNALGLGALLVLLRDGDLIFQAGVQLSFGVVLTIGLLHGLVGRFFSGIKWTEPYLPRSLFRPWQERWLALRGWLADMLTVSTSAWLGSAPLTAIHFGLVTPISIFASVALFVVVFPLLAVALLSASLAFVPGVSKALNQANAWFARSALEIAQMGAGVPGGNFSIPRGRPAEEFLIVFDVGSDGVAVWRGSDGCLLIDGASAYGFERVVLPSLREMSLRPERFVLTHPDGGHAGGLREALDGLPITEGIVPVLRAKSSNFRDLSSAADQRGVRLIRGHVGPVYGLDETASLEVLMEPDAWNWNLVADERIMPVRLAWRGWKILFMADAGWVTERALLANGVDLEADVIVAGRHLHDASMGGRFLEATGARALVMSHSDFPSVERIPESWREFCESRGIRVLHQGESGAATMTIEGGDLVIRGFVDSREIRLVPND